MKFRTLHLSAVAVAALSLTVPSLASASLVYDQAVLVSGQGFGASPRSLTLQATGRDTFQSGGLAWDGSGIVFGSVLADESSVFLGNGVTNMSGTSSMPNPLRDNQKYGVPTIGSLGITTADQIGVLFNATEPAGNSINLTDLTLKFYASSGTLLGAIDGSFDFLSSNAGNGVAGFSFVVDAIQQPTVDGWLAEGGAGTRLALEASLTNYAGGPESFAIYNRDLTPLVPVDPVVSVVPEPETYAMLLAGLGMIGAMVRRRRQA